jgi:hypothetical protein
LGAQDTGRRQTKQKITTLYAKCLEHMANQAYTHRNHLLLFAQLHRTFVKLAENDYNCDHARANTLEQMLFPLQASPDRFHKNVLNFSILHISQLITIKAQICFFNNSKLASLNCHFFFFNLSIGTELLPWLGSVRNGFQ